MADCMRTLNESGLREAVERAARAKPLLGVCVGEQMLFDRSEEGDTPCLGIFPGVVRRYAGPRYAPVVTGEGEACASDAGQAGAAPTGAELLRCRTWMEQSAPDALSSCVGRHPGRNALLFRP